MLRTPNPFQLATLVLTGCLLLLPHNTAWGQKTKKTKMDTPTISCDSVTQVSINITFKAGATGAPAGFSLQWMTAADYAANGNAWYLSDDPRLCKASFSGNANNARYNLTANESVTVKVGDFLFDNGASTNCDDDLTCGTEYVFRAFAHATSALMRSDFTGNLDNCWTLPCTGEISDCGCTYTQGYWKTHGPVPTGNNGNEWPIGDGVGGAVVMTLGTVGYTDLQLLAILKKPAAGDGLIQLAHQLIAAKLNIANGACEAHVPVYDVSVNVIAADVLIGGLVVPPVGSGSLSKNDKQLASLLINELAKYNEGATGPGHCGSN